MPVKAEKYGKPAREVAAAADAEGLSAAACESSNAALRFLSAREWPAPPRILIAGSPLSRRRGAGAQWNAAEKTAMILD